MHRLFAKHAFMQASDTELLKLRQSKHDLLLYVSIFNHLVAETHWPMEKCTSLFYQGLCEELKEVVSQVVSPPEDCVDFIDLVDKLNHCLSKRKGERRRFPAPYVIGVRGDQKEETESKSQPEPMQIGGCGAPCLEKKRKGDVHIICVWIVAKVGIMHVNAR